VSLKLEWKPYSGSGVFSLTSERRAPASEMRALFQRHRQGAADILFPSFPQLPLPEMVCFEDTKCQCTCTTRQGVREVDAAYPSSKLTQGTLFWSELNGVSPHFHIYIRGHGWYKTRERVAMWRHSPGISHSDPIGDSACLVTRYFRYITVCTRVNDGSAVLATPAQDWYHAVDPDLSLLQRPSSKIPCRDKSCINYYRSPASFACEGCPFHV